MAGLTPFPYKVITIASGVFSLDLIVFVVASLLSRGGRFGIEAALLWKFGEPLKNSLRNGLRFEHRFRGFVVRRICADQTIITGPSVVKCSR